MANEAVINGDAGLLYVYDTDAAAWLPSACQQSLTFNQTRNEVTRQTKCNPGVVEKRPGALDGSVDFDGLSVDTTSAASPELGVLVSWDKLFEQMQAGTIFDFWIDAGLADTDYYFSGFLNSLGLTMPTGDEDGNFSGTISISGSVGNVDTHPGT